jgi:hypothetical protein
MDRAFSVGVWLWATGAFRFLGEDFQAVAVSAAFAVLSKFLLDDIIRPIWLVRPNDPSGDRLRHQICELQSRRVVFFVHEPNVEVWHFASLIVAVADSAKLQLKLCIFLGASTLD